MKRFIHVTNAREVGFTFVNPSSQGGTAGSKAFSSLF